MRLKESQKRLFVQKVWSYYHTHRREMPWRKTRNPYKIFVSEIMLQQTQVSRVEEKYRLFLKKFPTIRKLAKAGARDVLVAWQGLGYNRRALLLWRAAQDIQNLYRGQIPQGKDKLTALPAVGDATAGAILAYAWNKPAVFVETNIRTVFIHHFFRKNKKISEQDLRELVSLTLQKNNPREWYYALMDYGAMLKSGYHNEHRKAAVFRAQPRFKGSLREARGAIIRALAKAKVLPKRSLAAQTGINDKRLPSALKALIKEGFVTERGATLSL